MLKQLSMQRTSEDVVSTPYVFRMLKLVFSSIIGPSQYGECKQEVQSLPGAYQAHLQSEQHLRCQSTLPEHVLRHSMV